MYGVHVVPDCARCGHSFDEGCDDDCLDAMTQARIDEAGHDEYEKLVEAVEDEVVLWEARAAMCRDHPTLKDFRDAYTECAVRLRRLLAGQKQEAA